MKLIAPDYYLQFKCIARACKHSCCIGWEIDIDKETCEYYGSIDGDFGKKLADNISDGEMPCFKLSENERCPFLNSENLCDIIINLGEDALCQICSDHPRFRNFYETRTEIGLGLCCEAAAKLILDKKDKTSLVIIDDDNEDTVSESDMQILNFRDSVIDALQNRNLDIFERIYDVLSQLDIIVPSIALYPWADIYSGLEHLDNTWSEKLKLLKTGANFEHSISDTSIEQLIVYFIYRHLTDGYDDGRVKERIAFAVLSVRIICALCAVCNEPVYEIARMYSSEIEYSEENMEKLLDTLSDIQAKRLSYAKENEISLCMEFIDDARTHQREQGFMQWTDTSPNIGQVTEDIENKRGYFLTDNGTPLGYFCLSFDGEPVYAGLEGKWLNESNDYAVIHRLAFGRSARGKGASRDVFRLAKEICSDRGVKSLRIDTHEDNKKMRHIIEREGFTYCGIVYYNGSPRMAFEKII